MSFIDELEETVKSLFGQGEEEGASKESLEEITSTPEEKARKKELSSSGSIDRDLAAGRARGVEMFDPGKRVPGISQDILSRRLAALEEGVPDSAKAAAQEQVGAQTNIALRKLQTTQAFKGLKGGVAAKQQGDVVAQGAAEGIRQQREIEQEDAALKREALERLSTEVNRRQFGILAREFGQAELGVAQRTGRQAISSAQGQSTGGGGLLSFLLG